MGRWSALADSPSRGWPPPPLPRVSVGVSLPQTPPPIRGWRRRLPSAAPEPPPPSLSPSPGASLFRHHEPACEAAPEPRTWSPRISRRPTSPPISAAAPPHHSPFAGLHRRELSSRPNGPSHHKLEGITPFFRGHRDANLLSPNARPRRPRPTSRRNSHSLHRSQEVKAVSPASRASGDKPFPPL